MIKPTVGRVVWYRPTGASGATHAAIVCGINSDTNVNLAVFGLYGDGPSQHTSVPLKQEDSETFSGPYAEWMPYQIGQAKAAATA
jgi:cell wall-associated NlpC family hydrolase